jgi:hypothetical protein
MASRKGMEAVYAKELILHKCRSDKREIHVSNISASKRTIPPRGYDWWGSDNKSTNMSDLRKMGDEICFTNMGI